MRIAVRIKLVFYLSFLFRTKLDKNISTDKASAGDPSKGVTGGSASSGNAAAAASASPSAAASATKASSTKKATKTASATSSAAAVETTAAASTNSAATGAFQLQDYAQFQISDGTAGNAQAEAAAIFVDPFAGQDLATVSDQTQDDIETMRQAAEAAETDEFNPAIDVATGADADALEAGKIKNKVLKLTGEVQVLKIKLAKAQAAGDDTASIQSKLTAEQSVALSIYSYLHIADRIPMFRTKLDKNIATDKASAGQASKGVA